MNVFLNYTNTLRPHQWIKNVTVFAPLIFSLHLFDLTELFKALLTFFSFCLASSSVYIINDILDRSADQNHPIKKFRPIASNKISTNSGIIYALTLLSVAILLSFSVLQSFFLPSILIFYWTMNFTYSTILKHIFIVDLLTIALGFVIRVFGGSVISNAPVSGWLLLLMFLLAFLLVTTKRRQELVKTNINSITTRKVIRKYSISLLNKLIILGTIAISVVYTMYTVSDSVVTRFETTLLLFTVPFVLLGLLRYLYIIFKTTGGEDPTLVLLTDYPLFSTVGIWTILSITIIYWEKINSVITKLF